MVETNPYLLGLTVVVSIVHSIFEFLAFKNGTTYIRVCVDNIITAASFQRHSVLEQSQIPGRFVGAFDLLWRLPIRHRAAVYYGQRSEFCG